MVASTPAEIRNETASSQSTLLVPMTAIRTPASGGAKTCETRLMTCSDALPRSSATPACVTRSG